VTACPWCGSTEWDGITVCPRSQRCPTCKAKPGAPCKRPSGHTAARLHVDRVKVAERLDDQRRQEDGVPPGQQALNVRGGWPKPIPFDVLCPPPKETP
jgi:hypothetical protein